MPQTRSKAKGVPVLPNPPAKNKAKNKAVTRAASKQDLPSTIVKYKSSSESGIFVEPRTTVKKAAKQTESTQSSVGEIPESTKKSKKTFGRPKKVQTSIDESVVNAEMNKKNKAIKDKMTEKCFNILNPEGVWSTVISTALASAASSLMTRTCNVNEHFERTRGNWLDGERAAIEKTPIVRAIKTATRTRQVKDDMKENVENKTEVTPVRRQQPGRNAKRILAPSSIMKTRKSDDRNSFSVLISKKSQKTRPGRAKKTLTNKIGKTSGVKRRLSPEINKKGIVNLVTPESFEFGSDEPAAKKIILDKESECISAKPSSKRLSIDKSPPALVSVRETNNNHKMDALGNLATLKVPQDQSKTDIFNQLNNLNKLTTNDRVQFNDKYELPSKNHENESSVEFEQSDILSSTTHVERPMSQTFSVKNQSGQLSNSEVKEVSDLTYVLSSNFHGGKCTNSLMPVSSANNETYNKTPQFQHQFEPHESSDLNFKAVSDTTFVKSKVILDFVQKTCKENISTVDSTSTGHLHSLVKPKQVNKDIPVQTTGKITQIQRIKIPEIFGPAVKPSNCTPLISKCQPPPQFSNDDSDVGSSFEVSETLELPPTFPRRPDAQRLTPEPQKLIQPSQALRNEWKNSAFKKQTQIGDYPSTSVGLHRFSPRPQKLIMPSQSSFTEYKNSTFIKQSHIQDSVNLISNLDNDTNFKTPQLKEVVHQGSENDIFSDLDETYATVDGEDMCGTPSLIEKTIVIDDNSFVTPPTLKSHHTYIVHNEEDVSTDESSGLTPENDVQNKIYYEKFFTEPVRDINESLFIAGELEIENSIRESIQSEDEELSESSFARNNYNISILDEIDEQNNEHRNNKIIPIWARDGGLLEGQLYLTNPILFDQVMPEPGWNKEINSVIRLHEDALNSIDFSFPKCNPTNKLFPGAVPSRPHK